MKIIEMKKTVIMKTKAVANLRHLVEIYLNCY